ncbi:hypothetical protein EMPG_13395 [Blastomyces silverae]|uniref:Uncharacterized protein n=1 Tax=Blastomyces silverae TaxID=2060906 RepID=A0A0H1BJ33_9EURO|nr:hypothetical protein EMPG_13395 [Blastomyces silverae]
MLLHRLLKTAMLHICQTLPCTTPRQIQICPSKLHAQVNIRILLLCHNIIPLNTNSKFLHSTLPNNLRNSLLNITLTTRNNNNNNNTPLLLRPCNINTNLNPNRHDTTLHSLIINPWPNHHLHTYRNNRRDTLCRRHSLPQNDKYNPIPDRHLNHSHPRNLNTA